jgi:SET domain-containing protein
MFIDASNDVQSSADSAQEKPFFVVRESRIHGKGVFAARKIPKGSMIIEYKGERITSRRAALRNSRQEDPNHTFFFSLESGRVIDGAVDGNDARWINHTCAPNCEALEEDGRVFIYALRDIRRGEELGYDYHLFLEERYTPKLKQEYACRCGAANCRGTMLSPKRRKAASRK